MNGIAESLRMVDARAAETTAEAFSRLFGAHGALGPALTALLTLYVALLAFGLLTGRTTLNLAMLTPRMLGLGLALTFVTSWVAYQSVMWNLLAGAPDQIASLILGTHGSATMLFADRLDQLFRAVSSAAQTAEAAKAAQPNHGGGGSFNPADLLWIASLMLLLGTVGLLIVARIALAAMLALGPIFILLALFRATRGLFEGWLKASVLFALMPLLTVLIGGGAIEMMAPAIDPLSMGGEITIETAVGVFLAASVYLALLAMALKAASTIISGWRLGAGRREATAAPSASASITRTASSPVIGGADMSLHRDRARVAMARLAMPSTGGSARSGALRAAAGGGSHALPAAAPGISRGIAAKTDGRIRAIAAIGRAAPVLALLLAGGAMAEEGRSRTVTYDEARVVSIAGKLGYQSTIEFGPGEHIENVAVGDSAAWQVTPNRRANLLFVKAMSEDSRSNMTVVTDLHTYMFDLATGKGGAVTYVLRFTYPTAVPAAEPGRPVEAKAQRVSAVTRETPPEPVTAWLGKGAAAVMPRRSFDDGRAVYLAWDKGVELPAILVPGPDESEGAVNYTVKGGYVVIDGLPDRVVLRRGEASAVLTRAEEE